jgi:FtsP/CotA-like multicopper oxidase with cupredoxin domain
VGAAVVGQALLAGPGEAGAARLADGGPAALVLVVGGDVADAGVQPQVVVLLAHGLQLARQVGRVGEPAQVRPLVLDMAEQRLDVGLVGRRAGTAVRTRGAMEMEGMLRNFFTINGKSYPDTEQVDVPAGKPVLLRLINAGQFAHPIHLHGTAFRVVARDGHAVPRALQERRDTITLESGERADIALTEPPGKWLLHCHIGHHLTNDGGGPGGLITLIKSA